MHRNSKGIVHLLLVVVLALAIPLFVWGIMGGNFDIKKRASSGEPTVTPSSTVIASGSPTSTPNPTIPPTIDSQVHFKDQYLYIRWNSIEVKTNKQKIIFPASSLSGSFDFKTALIDSKTLRFQYIYLPYNTNDRKKMLQMLFTTDNPQNNKWWISQITAYDYSENEPEYMSTMYNIFKTPYTAPGIPLFTSTLGVSLTQDISINNFTSYLPGYVKINGLSVLPFLNYQDFLSPNNNPKITNFTLPIAYVNKNYKATITSTDADGDYMTMSFNNLPEGLASGPCYFGPVVNNISKLECQIIGKPIKSGMYLINIVAKDIRGGTTSKTYRMLIVNLGATATPTASPTPSVTATPTITPRPSFTSSPTHTPR